MTAFERLFSPRGIAIVGAQEDPSRGGGQPLRALLAYGYTGAIHPVNPKRERIGDLRCYPTLREIEGPCDVAVIAVPASGVLEAVAQCAQKGIPFAVIYSAAFRESGPEGLAREREVLDLARRSGVRLIGPNCLGVVNVAESVYAAFGSMSREPRLVPGAVSVVSQSGGFGYSLVLRCAAAGVGFRHLVSSGNELDVTAPELIDAYLDDPGTRTVIAYIEGLADARALLEVGRKAVRLGKAILLWKAGNSEEGQRAAASHTGNMTGSYDIYRGALRQAGIVEVRSFEEVSELVKAFGATRRPQGRRVAVMSASGGAGAVFGDVAQHEGIVLAQPSAETARTLQGLGYGGTGAMNPIDCAPGFLNDASAPKFGQAVSTLLADANVDQVCMMLMTVLGRQALNGAHALAAAVRRTGNPVLVFSAVPRANAEEAFCVLEEAGIPVLSSPPMVARAAGVTAWHAGLARRLAGVGPDIESPATTVPAPPGSGTLSEAMSKALLSATGIATTADRLIRPGEAQDADVPPGRYAVKIASADIAHKTEVGGVKLGVEADAVPAAVRDVLAAVTAACPTARIDGVLVAPMIEDGVEMLVGVIPDPGFGPVVAVGLGGIFTEVLHDVSYRVAPFDLETAEEMIGELKGSAVLDGVRGRPCADRAALAQTLVKVSQLAWRLRDRVREIEINPLLVRPAGLGVVAADALVVLT